MPQPSKEILTTGADDLLELVKNREKISIEEAAKILRINIPTVQALVDFLVEEKVFGVEYKFTTPYVYLSKKEETGKKRAHESLTATLISKEEFYKKAERKSMPYEKITETWKKYLEQKISILKDEFYKKAKERNIPEDKINELWKKYLSHIQ